MKLLFFEFGITEMHLSVLKIVNTSRVNTI